AAAVAVVVVGVTVAVDVPEVGSGGAVGPERLGTRRLPAGGDASRQHARGAFVGLARALHPVAETVFFALDHLVEPLLYLCGADRRHHEKIHPLLSLNRRSVYSVGGPVSKEFPVELRGVIDPTELDAVRASFGRSVTLPGAAYTSQDVFEFEKDRFLTRSWVCAGRIDGLVGAGQARAIELGEER